MSSLPPFTLHNIENPVFPVLLSVPHAGRDYPAKLLHNLRVSADELLRLEDRYADRLVQPAIANGLSVIAATRARAWVDLNRAEHDFDDSMFTGGDIPDSRPSLKTRGGLGLFPRRLQNCGELWRGPLTAADYWERVGQCHRPYHHAIRSALKTMHARFGIALLLDVHSMPPVAKPTGQNHGLGQQPKFVIGDRFGRSAASLYAETLLAHLQMQGFTVGLNAPYAGDFVLDTHGQPVRNIHAIQLEVDRSLYLDPALREPTKQLTEIAQLVRSLALALAEQATGTSFAEAAE